MRFIVSVCALTALVVAFAGVCDSRTRYTSDAGHPGRCRQLSRHRVARMPTLVGGPGSAGYDAGFYIRGGDFLLRINADDPGTLRGLGLGRRGRSRAKRIRQGFPYGRRSRRASRCRARRSSSRARRRATSATTSSSSSATSAATSWASWEWHGGTWISSTVLGGLGLGNFGLGSWQDAPDALNYDNTREAWIEWCLLPVVQHPDGSGEDAERPAR